MKWINLALRILVEIGVVGAFAYWGYQTGPSPTSQVVLAVAAPLFAFGVWGVIDFRGAGRIAEPMRLIEELVISGLAAFALYSAGQPTLAVALAVVSILYHALVYLSGERLLTPRPHLTGRRREHGPAGLIDGRDADTPRSTSEPPSPLRRSGLSSSVASQNTRSAAE